MSDIEKKMRCGKCNGRVFLDRVFSDNKNYETSCLICGKREFVEKDSELGLWLNKQEVLRQHAGSLSR